MATRKPTPGPRAATKTPAPKAAAKRSAAPAKKPAPTGANAVADSAKPKHKLVRDSFTIPKSEYAVLDVLKQRAARLTRPAKKSEILRAGISALNAMADKAFLAVLSSVPNLKTGRPKRAKVTAEKAAAAKKA
jgi:hypothetical protein